MLILLDLLLILALSFVVGLIGLFDKSGFELGFGVIMVLLLFFYLLYIATIASARSKLKKQLGNEAESVPVRVWEVDRPIKGFGWVILWPLLGWLVWFLLWDLFRKYVSVRFYHKRIDLFWLIPPTHHLVSDS